MKEMEKIPKEHVGEIKGLKEWRDIVNTVLEKLKKIRGITRGEMIDWFSRRWCRVGWVGGLISNGAA
jgi:hypothetical protein